MTRHANLRPTSARTPSARTALARTPAARARRGSARVVGLALAGLVAAASVALVAYFALKGRVATPNNAGAAQDSTASSEAPPDVRSTPGAAGAGGLRGLGSGSGMRVQLMDKNDPTRLSSEIVAEANEPLEGKRYLVTKPQSWFYLKDGRIVHIRGDRGRLYYPDRNSQPESGLLEGRVQIRLYEPGPAGFRPDPENPAAALSDPEPTLTFNTDSMSFDGTIGEFSTNDPVSVTGDAVDFTGQGLRIVINQTLQRAELIEIARGDRLVYRPKAAKTARAKADATSTPAATPVATTAAPPAAPAAAPLATGPVPTPAPTNTPAPAPARGPIDTFYHAVFGTDVTLARGQQQITAQTMDVWAHLVDNKLPESAAATGSTTKSAATTSSKPADQSADGPATGPANGPASPATATPSAHAGAASSAQVDPAAASIQTTRTEDEVVLTWSGPLVIRPVETRPAELAKEELMVAFGAAPDGTVQFRDEKTGARGYAGRIDYGGTSRAIKLTGAGPESVRLALSDAGTLVASHVEVGLASGAVRVLGRGVLTAAASSRGDSLLGTPSEPAPPASPRAQGARRLSWSDQADFAFQTRDGDMTSILEGAEVNGDVKATDGDRSLQGAFLKAVFTARGNTSDVRRLTVRDKVAAFDGKDSALAADFIDVAFTPGSRGSEPATFNATGNVMTRRAESTLWADSLDAKFGPDKKGANTVSYAVARGNARFERTDGVAAAADEIRADTLSQIVDLSGRNASVAKTTAPKPADSAANTSQDAAARQFGRITGTQIRLEGESRKLSVFGPGRFEHEQSGKNGGAPGTIVALWTKGMAYDDRAGEITCDGECTMTYRPDLFTEDTLRAERTRILFDPAGEDQGSDRRVLSAWARGSDFELQNGKPAQIESRNFARLDDGTRGPLSRIAYLESTVIDADIQGATLATPGAGKMLVVDKSQPAEKAPDQGARTDVPPVPANSTPTSGPAQPAAKPADLGGPGNTLFTWRESMKMERLRGTVTMNGVVRVTHQRTGDNELIEMESEQLVGHFRELAANASDKNPQPDAATAIAAAPSPGEASPIAGAPQPAEPEKKRVRAEFTGAEARGAVWARSGNRELLADNVDYDADASVMKAWSDTDRVVTIFDGTSPSPQTAQLIFWDLRKDRLEIRKPGTIIVPR